MSKRKKDKPARADSLGLDIHWPDGEKTRLATLGLDNSADLDTLQELIDQARETLDRREEMAFAPHLLAALLDLGEQYGALDVARAAASLTDTDVLFESLDYEIIPDMPEELKWWRRAPLGDAGIDMTDDFEGQISR